MEDLALDKADTLSQQIVGCERARDPRPPLFTDGSRPLHLEGNSRGLDGQQELHTMELIQILRNDDN